MLRTVGSTASAGRSMTAPARLGSAATLTATTRVLRALEGAAAGLTPAAIALRAGVPKPTSDAVLAALEHEGFVDRAPIGRRFRIGDCLLRIAASAGETRGGTESAP